MPDKFGWCSVERDGPPKHPSWYIVSDEYEGVAPGVSSWTAQFWSGSDWQFGSTPKFYLQSPGKEAYKASPKPQPCPICESKSNLCNKDYVHYVSCGKNKDWSQCLVGPVANNAKHACMLWNSLRREKDNEPWIITGVNTRS